MTQLCVGMMLHDKVARDKRCMTMVVGRKLCGCVRVRRICLTTLWATMFCATGVYVTMLQQDDIVCDRPVLPHQCKQRQFKPRPSPSASPAQ